MKRGDASVRESSLLVSARSAKGERGGRWTGTRGSRRAHWYMMDAHEFHNSLTLLNFFFFNFLLSSLIFKTALYTRTHRRHLAADQCNLINQLNHDAKLLPQIVSATVLEKI